MAGDACDSAIGIYRRLILFQSRKGGQVWETLSEYTTMAWVWGYLDCSQYRLHLPDGFYPHKRVIETQQFF